jgi:hypothetical protein
MRIIYKTSKWLDTQAKTLERKILNAKRTSPSWSTLSRLLTQNKAIIELRDCDDNSCVIVLDETQYKLNKKDIVDEYLLAN